MTPYFQVMPVDNSTIRTRIRIHPDLLASPDAFVRDHDFSVRTMKPTRGRRSHADTWNLTLDVLTYKGIKVKLTQIGDDPMVSATIDFNPGVCLYGHNGRILHLTEFLDALALLVTHLTPLLSDQDDWVDLVPGLRSGGPAYWSYLEVPFQCRDPDGALLARLRHLRHPKIRTASRHWPDSIKVGPHRGKLQFSIYRKAKEMAKAVKPSKSKLSKSKLAEDSDILRLEARMKGTKLVLYFGNERNIEWVDGKKRLVRFFPQDLVLGHRTSFSELLGVYSPYKTKEEKNKHPKLSAQGRVIAAIASDPRTSQSFPALMSLVKYYTGASSSTIGKIMKAGLAELSRLSPISSAALFSDAAYGAQFGIASMKSEKMISYESDEMISHRLIVATYRPPGQPFYPHTELPSYSLRKNPDEDETNEKDH